VRRRVEDLHGLDVLTAVRFARTRVREAYENGYDEIELLHGAADVLEPVANGRGRIKWELRRLLERGELDRWSRREDSWPRASSLVVALKRNPRPRREAWTAPPRAAHGRRD
jgi:predicted DNA-binding protein